MEIAIGVVCVLLFIIAGRLEHIVQAVGRLAEKLDKALKDQAKLFDAQNQNLINIGSSLNHMNGSGYIAPTVRFCDRCRKEFPEPNRWWTAYRGPSLRLCAYPQQKERPKDMWLHGEQCILAEAQAFMANMRRALERTTHKQKREYREYVSHHMYDEGQFETHS